MILLQSSSPFLGRRFSDAAANVPIKKRRIQLEMARSPSPPPGSMKLEPGTAAVHEVLEVTKPSGSQASEEVNVTMAIESDGNGGRSLESFPAAQVQKVDEAPAAALNVSEEDLVKGHTLKNPSVTALETNLEGDIVVGQSPQMGQLDLVIGCKSEKGDGESQQWKGNRCVTENGTTPTCNRRKGESGLVSQVDVQLQILPVNTGNTCPTSEGEQVHAVEPVVMSEHLLSSGLSKVRHAGSSSEEVLADPSRGEAVLSPNSKRKFSETDMSHPVRDHLGVESRRPVNRVENVNFQTSIAGSTAEEQLHTQAPHGIAMMEASTLAGKNNSLRDDRLHWDLNMDMEEWERPSEEDSAVASGQNLSSISNTEMEKTESLHGKKSDEELHKGAAVSSSASFEDGILEQKPPPQDIADAIEKTNGSEVSGGSLKSEVQVERKDELSLTHAGSCDTSSKLAEGHPREKVPSISSGGIVGTHTAKQHDCTADEPEVDCNSLQADESISVLREDSRPTELEIALVPDQEAEALDSEEAPPVIGHIEDKETKGRAFLAAEKGATDLDIPSSELKDIRADTACVHEEEDICGTYSVKALTDDSSEAADGLQSEKKSGSSAENMSQLAQSEGVITPTNEPTSAVPVAELSSIRNVIELHRCDEAEGASHDESLVDKQVVEEFTTDGTRSSTSPSRQPAPLKWEGDNGEDLEAENVDYGDSDLREGDDHDVEDRIQRGTSEVESTWNPYGETKISDVQSASTSQSHRGNADDSSNVMGTRKRRYGSEITSAEEFREMDVEKAHALQVDDPNCGSILGKSSTISDMNGGLAVEEVMDRDATVFDIVHLSRIG